MGRYWLAAGTLGAAATWGSENLFWSAPPAGWTPLELAVTWVVYSLCVAAALSAVLWSGVQGWRAVFLGGAVLGWLIEGVVVATMYAAFPFQVVWTPLAWHALVTGVGVVGLGRMAAAWSGPRMLAAWAGLGAWAGLFALFWPLERDDLPSGWPAVGQLGWYVGLLGLVVPAAHLTLDRLGTLARPSRRTLLIAPALLGAAWLVRFAVTPGPLLLTLPALLGLTVWAMGRLGTRGAPLSLGAPARPERHLLFVAAPVVATAVAATGWTLTDGWGANAPVAVLSCGASLWLLGGCLRRAVGRQRVRPRRSS
ncbi:MAG: hypothetical protein U0R80_01100 [Nocardioidaceae bacterium]